MRLCRSMSVSGTISGMISPNPKACQPSSFHPCQDLGSPRDHSLLCLSISEQSQSYLPTSTTFPLPSDLYCFSVFSPIFPPSPPSGSGNSIGTGQQPVHAALLVSPGQKGSPALFLPLCLGSVCWMNVCIKLSCHLGLLHG